MAEQFTLKDLKQAVAGCGAAGSSPPEARKVLLDILTREHRRQWRSSPGTATDRPNAPMPCAFFGIGSAGENLWLKSHEP